MGVAAGLPRSHSAAGGVERDGVRVVVANSGVKHGLVGGEYANRRWQCGEAVAWLGRIFSGVRSLCDATMEMLEAARVGMDQTVYRRWRACDYGERADGDVCGRAGAGGFAECGALMYGSHASLRDDYEVSWRNWTCWWRLRGRAGGVRGRG